MKSISKFYRTTEGLVTLIAVYVLLAAGVQLAVPVMMTFAGAAAVPASIALILFGGAGAAMGMDAISRLASWVERTVGPWLNEVANS